MAVQSSKSSMLQSGTPRPDAPIVDWDGTRPFQIYSIDEVYDVENKKGKWFPNVNDLIVDYRNSMFQRVTYADKTSLVYKTVPWNQINPGGGDAVAGGGGPDINRTIRVLINDRVYPPTLRCDSRLQWAGADNVSYRVFRGYDISENGEVISAYIVDGKLEGNRIPLELAAINEVDNKTIMSPLPGHAKGSFENYEPCTIVVYGTNDTETSIEYGYIVKTNFVMSQEDDERVIRGIELLSPFLSPSDNLKLDLPINIPLEDIPLTCRVSYNDGFVDYPVDGTRASLDGLESTGSFDKFYISSLTGQRIDVQLKYRMAPNESYVGDDLFDTTIIKDYVAETLPIDGAYSVKLYVLPQWLDVARGYRLRYFLYNMTRGNFFEATAHVERAINGAIFDPKLYGVKQTLAVTCNLESVSPVYNAHVHVQTFAITLLAPGSQNSDPYLIEYNPTESVYGENCNIKFDYDNVKYWAADVRCDAKDKSEWLQRLYRNIHPLYDRRTESEAPDPTHFDIVIGDKVYSRIVNDWLTPFNIDFRVDEGDEVYIRWIKRTPTDDLQLGLTPLIARQIG